MPNPYAATTTDETDAPRQHAVASLVVWAALVGISAYSPLSTGLRLLNQELGLFPAAYATYDIEINGAAVSIRSVMVSTLATGLLFLSIATVLGLRARRNHKHNKAIRLSGLPQDGESSSHAHAD